MPFLASARRAATAAAAMHRTAIPSACYMYSTNGSSSAPFLTLSFSGAGHLLSYHLGVAASLHRASAASNGNSNKRKPLPTIKAVSGSSSGAIAATVFVRLPHRIEEYADTFLAEGGRAFAILKDMLHDEERRLVSAASAAAVGNNGNGNDNASKVASRVEVLSPGQSAHHNTRRVGGRSGSTSNPTAKKSKPNSLPPSLHVATTKCETGQLHMFDFRPVHPEFRTISAAWTNDELLQAVEASCRIPQSFHPADVLESPLSGMVGAFGGGNGGESAATYPDGDGVSIRNNWYVDGGIAAPAPPTPFDNADNAIQVVISPISGSPMDCNEGYVGDDGMDRHRQTHRISPSDDTRRLLPFELRLRGGLSVFPSMQNLRALGISAGAASKDDLMRWYDAGRDDGEAFIHNLRL